MKHAFNNDTQTEYKVLVSCLRFTALQMMLIDSVVSFYDTLVASDSEAKISDEDRTRYAKRLYRRSELIKSVLIIRANDVRFSDTMCIYFVTKNKALQTNNHLYDLKRCKALSVKNDAVKAIAKTTAKKALKSATETIDTSNVALALIEA